MCDDEQQHVLVCVCVCVIGRLWAAELNGADSVCVGCERTV